MSAGNKGQGNTTSLAITYPKRRNSSPAFLWPPRQANYSFPETHYLDQGKSMKWEHRIVCRHKLSISNPNLKTATLKHLNSGYLVSDLSGGISHGSGIGGVSQSASGSQLVTVREPTQVCEISPPESRH